jgi:hypothetical protein
VSPLNFGRVRSYLLILPLLSYAHGILSTGTIVEGTFFCRKDKDNKRELEVEIHYEVRESEGDVKGKAKGGRVVQSYKVR